MSHELQEVNGTIPAAFALKGAWHRLGTVLDHVPNGREMRIAAGLEFHVSMRALQTAPPYEASDIPGYMATYRDDTNQFLGMVSERYKVVQNEEAFEFLDGLITEGEMKYESAGALRGGARIWALARMPSYDEIAEGDVSKRYVLFSTSHDGGSALYAMPTSVRVVCANTLRIATAGSIGIRHTGDMKGKLDQAKKIISQYDAKFDLFRDQARVLATRQMSDAQAKEYVATLFPEPNKSESPRAHSNWQAEVDRVRAAYRSPRQQLRSIRGTWWAMLNAVTETVDHARDDDTAKLKIRESRFLSRLEGEGADFKDKALKLAIEMAV